MENQVEKSRISRNVYEPLETYILKVNINCQGCKTKVKKTLRKIQGVYSVDIDTDQQAVIIRGNLDPETLVKKLIRRGKHAEILLIIPNHKDHSGLNHHDNNNNISSRNTTHYHFNNVPSYERTNLLNQQSDEEKMMMNMNMNMKPVMMNDADYFHMNNQSENFQELFGEIPRRNNYEEANPNVMKDMDIGYANAYPATETMNMSIGRGPSLVPQAMNQEQFNSKQLHRSYY